MKEPEEKKKNQNKEAKLAVVSVRGVIKARSDVVQTLEILNLKNQNHCVVLPATPSVVGMLRKVKDYVTWGEIDSKLYDELIKKRGELYTGRLEDRKGKIKYTKYILHDGKKYKKYFRLSPPKGGFERKGIKKSFSQGGALGYRKDKIQELIKKMI